MIFFSVAPIFGQQPKTILSQNKIEVGEKITLSYVVVLKNDDKISFNPSNTFIPAIRLKDTDSASSEKNLLEILTPFRDTIIEEANQQLWVGIYEITAWEPDTYQILEQPILINGQKFILPSVKLSAELVEARKDKEFYDIKESFAEIPVENNEIEFLFNYWWVLLLIVLVLIAFILWIKRKSSKTPMKLILAIDKRAEAIAAIEQLEQKKLWEKNQLKVHYVELSLILRTYLSDSYQINLLEKTTTETCLLLKQLNLDEETLTLINGILEASDLVKFAKSHTDETVIYSISDAAKKVILKIDPVSRENVE